MANWIGTSRTNYVLCTDRTGLVNSLEGFAIDVRFNDDDQVMFMDEGSDDGNWPFYRTTEEGEEEDFDWALHVMPFIAEGEVLVVAQAGAEKRRYVTGWSEAYVRKGKEVSSVAVSINDIYQKASHEFGIPAERISVAEY